MKLILSRAGRGLLARYAHEGTLLALDFDGTLAPIVRDPERARLRARTRGLLQRAAALYPTAVVSGRARADVRRRLAGTGVREVVGNHGIEPWDEAPAHERRAALWQAALRRRLARAPGVTIEDKRFSLAVHYRRAPRAAVARAAILDAVRDLRGFRLVPGKRVLNLVPKKAAHKGTGLEALRKRFGCAAAIYVGDDETDEDAFALGRRGRLLAIRVGRRRGSAAGYYLRNQREIDRLLEELVAVFRPVGPSRV